MAECLKQGWLCEPMLEEGEAWLRQKDLRNMAERLEEHKAWREKLLDSAAGGAGLWQNVTKPLPWSGERK